MEDKKNNDINRCKINDTYINNCSYVDSNYIIPIHKNILTSCNYDILECDTKNIIFKEKLTIFVYFTLHVKIKTDTDILYLNHNDNRYKLADLHESIKQISFQQIIVVNKGDILTFNDLDNIKIKESIINIWVLPNNNYVNTTKFYIELQNQSIYRMIDNILVFNIKNPNTNNIDINESNIFIKNENKYKLKFSLYIELINYQDNLGELEILNNNIVLETIPFSIDINKKFDNIKFSKILKLGYNVNLSFNIKLTTTNTDYDGILILPNSYIYITTL